MQVVGAEGVIATNKSGYSKKATLEAASKITGTNAARIAEREISRGPGMAGENRNCGGTRRW